MALQRSALYQFTGDADITMRERFGWELPVTISTAANEYLGATAGVAVHDISYVGRLHAIGEDALDLLNRLSTNKVDELASGQGAPTILTTDSGRILDLIQVVNMGDHTLMITSPELQQALIEWLDKYTIMEDLEVEDHTTRYAMLHLLGPHSRQWLEQTGSVDLASLSPYGAMPAKIAGVAVQVIDKPFGPLPGFALLLSNQDAPELWTHLMETGVTPMGTEAYETVRVENAVPAYGAEMGEPYNPLEAGLIGSIDFAKGCYIGQEVIARLDTYQKVQKHLMTLRFSAESTPMAGSGLVQDGRVIGRVTSLGSIPGGRDNGHVVGLGYVRKAFALEGTRLELEAPAVGWAEITGFSRLFGPGA
ncbi:MAG: hypothetical protein BZY80_00560 [SAR202 cluster bacterium Io17-Chloro-G2]|nr:MAG: hypothetical protein BZY80_00560 [SAR202 cluster bacterium Io17-Chloro-G2]